jgi:UDP-N-acetylglucosamine:LPS N-acetylglucosamine transferase
LEYLKVAKGVITLSGHTILSEILAYKKPALVFPIPNYLEQYQNSYLMRDYIINGEMDKLGLIYMRNKMDEFLENIDTLNEKLKNYNIKKNGAAESADIILQTISK